MRMADIFLSYSREDEARAKNLVAEFEARGWSVFWDRRIPAGQTWRTHIGSALQNARCVVVTWSKQSVESQWVCEEADEGKSRGVLVPVLLDPVQPPRGFREIQAADLCNWQPGQASERLAELLEDLQRMLGGQRVSTPERKTPEEPIAPKPEPVERLPNRSRSRAFAIGGAVLGVAVLGFVVIGYFSTSSTVTQKQVAPPRAETTPAAQAGSWLVIAGSFRAHERDRAFQVRDALVRAGIQAEVVVSNDYPLLTPGLFITRVGPFEQKEEANHALREVRRVVIDAYVKKGR